MTASSARTALFTADEQRDDHVGEHDDVAQRQHRQQLTLPACLLGFRHRDLLWDSQGHGAQNGTPRRYKG